jgi:uncharacterized membrane protein
MTIRYPDRKYWLQYAPPLTVKLNGKKVQYLREGKTASIPVSNTDTLELKIGFWIKKEVSMLSDTETYFLSFSKLIRWFKFIEIPLLLGVICYINLVEWSTLSLVFVFILYIAALFSLYKIANRNEPISLIQ